MMRWRYRKGNVRHNSLRTACFLVLAVVSLKAGYLLKQCTTLYSAQNSRHVSLAGIKRPPSIKRERGLILERSESQGRESSKSFISELRAKPILPIDEPPHSFSSDRPKVIAGLRKRYQSSSHNLTVDKKNRTKLKSKRFGNQKLPTARNISMYVHTRLVNEAVTKVRNIKLPETSNFNATYSFSGHNNDTNTSNPMGVKKMVYIDKMGHSLANESQQIAFNAKGSDLESQSKDPLLKWSSKQRLRCLRIIAIYTRSLEPFNYWPEYADLKQMFIDAANRRGRDESSPAAHVRCPRHTCDIDIIPTDDEQILTESDVVVLNVAPLLIKAKLANLSHHLVKLLPNKTDIVFYSMESPPVIESWVVNLQDTAHHYSMTYHSLSDIVLPYGRYVPGQPMELPGKPVNHTENKTALISWMASNCDRTFWPRLEWVTQLREHVQVDVYGKCGTKSCLPMFSEECMRKMRSYKFYLALESAQCDEYITEKFWVNSLMNGVVPVVYGGRTEAYERVAPPKSFIHVADFSSPKELAEYLIMLDKDNTLYEEYFAWRREGHVENLYPRLQPYAFCELLQPNLPGRVRRRAKRVGDIGYFKECRREPQALLAKKGDMNGWSPWR
ncbi:uncharacterized protein [Diadema antillarum]|uniref:uncharacterized protein n=1 Tax=Diadema antillarum TaxID=105358 RepID=UPI003A83A902